MAEVMALGSPDCATCKGKRRTFGPGSVPIPCGPCNMAATQAWTDAGRFGTAPVCVACGVVLTLTEWDARNSRPPHQRAYGLLCGPCCTNFPAPAA